MTQTLDLGVADEEQIAGGGGDGEKEIKRPRRREEMRRYQEKTSFPWSFGSMCHLGSFVRLRTQNKCQNLFTDYQKQNIV